MWYSAAVTFRLLGAQMRSQMQYRGSFVLQVVGQFFVTFVDFITVALLFSNFPTIDGWSFAEVAFLYGTGAIAFALADLAVGDFERLSLMVREGTFDRVMTRPVSAFVQVLAADFQLRRLGRAAQGALVLAIALSMLDIAWSPLKVGVMLAGIVSGMVIFACIFVVGAAISFWTLQDSEVLNVFTYGGSEMVSYPMTIYGDWLRRFFTFVIPLAFVTYFPALVVLDRTDPVGLPHAVYYASPLVALLFVFVARGLWTMGLRHYQSTGS